MKSMSQALDRLIAGGIEETPSVGECPILTALEHADDTTPHHES